MAVGASGDLGRVARFSRGNDVYGTEPPRPAGNLTATPSSSILERPLDLLQLALLVFWERHDASREKPCA